MTVDYYHIVSIYAFKENIYTTYMNCLCDPDEIEDKQNWNVKSKNKRTFLRGQILWLGPPMQPEPSAKAFFLNRRMVNFLVRFIKPIVFKCKCVENTSFSTIVSTLNVESHWKCKSHESANIMKLQIKMHFELKLYSIYKIFICILNSFYYNLQF